MLFNRLLKRVVVAAAVVSIWSTAQADTINVGPGDSIQDAYGAQTWTNDQSRCCRGSQSIVSLPASAC